MSELDAHTIMEAFQFFKTDKQLVENLKYLKLKPSPDMPIPNTRDFMRWTMGEWCGFLYKYVTPRSKQREET